MRSGRGFTLLELLVAMAIVAILAGIGAFSIDRIVKQVRTNDAARNLLLDLRMAQSIAIRTNRTTRFVLRRDPTDGCPGESYVIEGSENPLAPADTFDARYRMVCIPNVYPQVVVGAESAPANFGPLTCINDAGADPPTPLTPDGCTFCGGGTTGTLTFRPSGEILATPVQGPTFIEALSFTWRDDPAVPNPAAPASQVRAVSINLLGGRGRLLQPTPAAANALPSVWGCR